MKNSNGWRFQWRRELLSFLAFFAWLCSVAIAVSSGSTEFLFFAAAEGGIVFAILSEAYAEE